MRVFSIQSYGYNKSFSSCGNAENYQVNSPSEIQPSFGCTPNSKALKKLFAYGIPDIYSSKIMIDPKAIHSLMSGHCFERKASSVLALTKRWKSSLGGNEKKLYLMIEKTAKLNPDLTISQIVKSFVPEHELALQKIQLPIIDELKQQASNLPDDYRYKINQLLLENQRKIEGKSIYSNFSTTDFQYNLDKILHNICNKNGQRYKKTLSQMYQESRKFAAHTNKNTIDIQKKVFSNIYSIWKKSSLKKDVTLSQLMEITLDKLNSKPVLERFKRKSFIYDFCRILDNYADIKHKKEMYKIAEQIPTSKNSLSAFIVKLADKKSEDIMCRILTPSTATVEHLLPRSCQGANDIANYTGASSKENSARGSIEFSKQLVRKPNTPKYAQRQMDKYIELANNGIFKKEHIDVQYIYDFQNTIAEQSEGKVLLDISKLRNDIMA